MKGVCCFPKKIQHVPTDHKPRHCSCFCGDPQGSRHPTHLLLLQLRLQPLKLLLALLHVLLQGLNLCLPGVHVRLNLLQLFLQLFLLSSLPHNFILKLLDFLLELWAQKRQGGRDEPLPRTGLNQPSPSPSDPSFRGRHFVVAFPLEDSPL